MKILELRGNGKIKMYKMKDGSDIPKRIVKHLRKRFQELQK